MAVQKDDVFQGIHRAGVDGERGVSLGKLVFQRIHGAVFEQLGPVVCFRGLLQLKPAYVFHIDRVELFQMLPVLHIVSKGYGKGNL